MPRSSRAASAQASSAVSRVMTWKRMPNSRSAPLARVAVAARSRIRSSRPPAASGGSPHSRYVSTWVAATASAASDAPPKKIGGDSTGEWRVVAASTR